MGGAVTAGLVMPSGPVVRNGTVMWAPRPERLVDEVHPGLFLGGSWQRHELAGRYDWLLDCRFFADSWETPPHLGQLVSTAVAAVRRGERVLVRCQLGLNRSALIVALVLRELTGCLGSVVVHELRQRRSPHVLCNPRFVSVVMGDTDGWTYCADRHQHWGVLGGAGLLLAAGGRVLVQQRAGWTHQGGTWGLPGGARGAGESPVAAAFREAAEETGADLTGVELVGEHVDECAGWPYVTTVARAAEPLPVRDSREGVARWVPVDEVPSLPLHPGLRRAWPALRELL